MLIDWFTVGAQALNFFILIWLMKRFLYGPILRAIDAREARIAAELADADSKRSEARRERDEFQRKIEEFDQQKAELLRKATVDAESERQRLLEAVRKEADASRAKRMEALRNDARNLDRELVRRAREEVFAIARKVLRDLASASLEERMTDAFTARLRAMEGSPRAVFATALKTASAPALVRTAFDLPAEQRAAIQAALRELSASEIPVRFEIAPDLVAGIEASANGRKVAWSIADELASLEKGVEAVLGEADAPGPSAPAPVRNADEPSA